MVLFAQIADVFSDNTWNILLGICLASPLLGATVNVFVKQNASIGAASFVLSAYYLILGSVYFVITRFGEPLAACLVFFFLLLCGPIFGLSLLLERRHPKLTQTGVTDD